MLGYFQARNKGSWHKRASNLQHMYNYILHVQMQMSLCFGTRARWKASASSFSPLLGTLIRPPLTLRFLLCLWSSRHRLSSLLRARMARLCSLCSWSFSLVIWACLFCRYLSFFCSARCSSSWARNKD